MLAAQAARFLPHASNGSSGSNVTHDDRLLQSDRDPGGRLTGGIVGHGPGHGAGERLGLDLHGIERAHLPAGHPPVLLVVLDTEEEFDWASPLDRSNRSVTAIQGLVPLQSMFDEVGIRPTYVIDHPVATRPESAGVLRGFLERGVAEVGAHLHPWVTPPHLEEVNLYNSYGGNLDAPLEHAKLESLVEAIEAGVGIRPRTFKAGRYGLGKRTPMALRQLGFEVDLSTSPGFNWTGDGGPDYRGYPNFPYWIPGQPPLLEIPTTGGHFGPLSALGPTLTPVNNLGAKRNPPLVALLRKLRLSRRIMLTPEGSELWEMQALAEKLLEGGESVLTLSFHSPTVLPILPSSGRRSSGRSSSRGSGGLPSGCSVHTRLGA
jgi:hypothetical protein